MRFLAVLAILAHAACAVRSVEVSQIGDLGWPSWSPRVRLQSIVDLVPRSAGPWRASAGPTFRRPYGVVWDGADLLVTDAETGTIARVGDSGQLTLAPQDLFLQPSDVAVCPSGILVTDPAAGRVALLDDDLRLVRWLAQGLARPTGVTCHGGRTFVVETAHHRILTFVDGAAAAPLGSRGTAPGQFNFPTSVTAHDGTLLVGDALNFRIQRIDPATGRALGVFGSLGDSPGEMARLKGVAVDLDGHVWAADAHLDRISLYGLNGDLLLSIGGTGSRPGEFSFPAGIAVGEDGRIAVVDSLNRRIKIFELVDRATRGDA